MSGVFPKWQPLYAEHGIATFPVGADKKPAVKGYGRVGQRGSAALANKFHYANAFGYMLGEFSRVTVLDVDSTDQADLADALNEHSDTQLIVRTGGGYHAYYRHSGEGRHIRPDLGKARDILGGGFIVAPRP